MPRWRPSGSVRWAVEADGILLLSDDSGATRFLAYPQAAIWDLMSRGNPLRQIAVKMCAIASLSPSEAEQLVLECADDLTAGGFLESGDEHG